MPTDYFETVTALDGHRNDAVKRRAGIKTAEEPAKPATKEEKIDHAPALKAIDDESYDLRAKGRELMKKNQQNTPEYDALVVRNKELRRKRMFLEDSAKD